MAHLHTGAGQYDLTVSAYIVRRAPEPAVLLHRHKTLGIWMQHGGHVELDETPWQALVREIREETGYDPAQLCVLQPPRRLAALTGDLVHPQPVCVRSVPFGVGTNHFHTDLTYAFVTAELPAYDIGPEESGERAWLTVAEVQALPPGTTYPDVRELSPYIVRLLAEWEDTPLLPEWADNPPPGSTPG